MLRFVIIIFLFEFALSANYKVYVNTSSPVRTVSDKFLSVTLDTGSSKTNFSGLNFSFITPLAKALSPAYLRFGGSDADNLIFQENLTLSNEFEFYGEELDELYNFTTNSGLRLIFDLNIGLRVNNSVNGTWNSSNAEQLINYASSHNYVMDFELGNEPDFLYFNNGSKILNGSQIADDYRTLRNILNSNNLYKNSMLFGPSPVTTYYVVASRERQLVSDFLNNNGGNYIDALSFHYYYMYEGDATLQDFLNATVLNWFLNVLNVYKSLNFTPLIISETSSAYGGGKKNLSDTYAAGFVWLDKLGLSALHGLDVVTRQAIFGGNYALLDNKMMPLPTLYLRFLSNNGIVFYGQTISNDTFTLDFPQFSNQQATVYILKEGEPGNLLSKTSQLNGHLTTWIPHQPGPNLVGVVSNLPIIVPGYSQFYIVLGQTTNTKCPNGWYQETTTPNKCIKFVSETQPLFSARFDCNTFNGTLLSIDSAFENAEILQQLSKVPCNQYSIDLTRNGNDWTWSSDPSSYRNWKNGYPTDDNTQNCVVFGNKDGNWYNADCDTLQCYICQTYV